MGTIYQVYRRLGPDGAFEYIGGAGQRKFVDATIPAGTPSVTYQLQSVRSTAVGPWSQFNVGFGITAAGTPAAKMAA
ncbi:MAG TPA: hypothetical protein VK324_17910 [Tepidisphaeraceae bacterium]|nr:hypothetical protein [Tepidisphaeraceae bacterium]